MNRDDVIDATHAYMSQLYPGWHTALLDMLGLCQMWAAAGVYIRDGPRTADTLIPVYEELYLALTNAIPNKPPLAGTKEPR